MGTGHRLLSGANSLQSRCPRDYSQLTVQELWGGTGLKIPSKTLELLAAKAVKTTGQRRGTKYHVGSGAAKAAPADASAPAKAAAPAKAKKA
jgi:hypothetical protein